MAAVASCSMMAAAPARVATSTRAARSVVVPAPLAGFSASVRGTSLSASAPSVTRARASVAVQARQGGGRGGRREEPEFEERVVQVQRVTKVVKGGKQMRFRAVVVVGNGKGTVGVGCASAKEVIAAVEKASVDAKRALVQVPLTSGALSFPHKDIGIYGAAKVMLRPAADGTGVIAGGAPRVVLELAGVKNGFAKQLGSPNALNNAKATVEGLSNMFTFKEVAETRGVTVEYLMGMTLGQDE